MAAAARRLLSGTLNPNSTLPALPPEPLVTVESDFVVIIAALLCALICLFGLLAVARCAWLRTTTTTNNNNSTHSSYHSTASNHRGLKKKILNSFPKFVLDDEKRGEFDIDECCAICLAEFVDGEEIRVLPQCGHGFHVVCVDTWLARRSSCPSCRRILDNSRCMKCGHLSATGNVSVIALPIH